MRVHQNKQLLTRLLQILIPPLYFVLLTEGGSVERVSSLQFAGNSLVEEDEEEEVNPRSQSKDHGTVLKITTTEQFYFYKGFFPPGF